MWICLNDAFFSVVAHRDKPNVLLVRARNREHLEKYFPGELINELHDADYRYRVEVYRRRFAAMIATKIDDIDYPNFKNSVKESLLSKLYNSFWGLHWNYQEDQLRR
jgi:hypothetical protein